jgi:hypothetical protein
MAHFFPKFITDEGECKMNKEEKSKISIEIGRRLSEIRRFRKLSLKRGFLILNL